MFDAGGHDINPGGVDTAVTQDVGKLGDVLLDTIESSSKELPQVMGKHLGFFHTRNLTKLFHLPPNSTAVKRFSALANKDRPGRDMLVLSIIQQQFSQLARHEDRPSFAFAVHRYFATPHRFNGKIPQF